MMNPSRPYQGNDKLLFGLVLGVIAFWMFAQSALNVAPVIQKDLGLEADIMNIAVAITALFSGMLTVVLGGLADRFGRVKMVMWGFVLSIVGALLIGFAPRGSLSMPLLLTGRAVQGISVRRLYHAGQPGFGENLLGRRRQAAGCQFVVNRFVGRLGIVFAVRRFCGGHVWLALDFLCLRGGFRHRDADGTRHAGKQGGECGCLSNRLEGHHPLYDYYGSAANRGNARQPFGLDEYGGAGVGCRGGGVRQPVLGV